MDTFSDAITLKEAAGMLPGRPHANTIFRWATRGTRGHKIKTVKFSGKRFTRPAWIREFVQAVIDADPQRSQFDEPPVTTDRKEHHRTTERLAKLGVK